MMKNLPTPARSEAWHTKFKQQVTPALLGRLRRAARSRMRTFAGPDGYVSPADVEDLVSDVIADTLEGRLTWDPDKKPLEHSLLDAVRFRARNRAEREQAQAQLCEPMDEEERDRTIADSACVQDMALAPTSPEDERHAGRIRTVCGELVEWLRARVADKPEARRLFDLYLEGITDRDDVMRESRMDMNAYRNARRCLDRIVQRVPERLRAAAFEVLDAAQVEAIFSVKLAS